MTGYVLLALSAAVPTLAVFLATFAFLRVRRENDALREEVDALRAHIRAWEEERRHAAWTADREASTAATDAGEDHDQ